MSKKTDLLYTLLTVLFLVLFMFAVSSPRVSDEADTRYREELMDRTEDNWLLQYT